MCETVQSSKHIGMQWLVNHIVLKMKSTKIAQVTEYSYSVNNVKNIDFELW